MDSRYLKAIFFYLIVLCLLFFLQKKLREKFWVQYGRVVFPLMITALLLFNLLSFQTINESNKWSTLRLPSNSLLDLMKNSLGLSRTSWMYTLIGEYYSGRTVLIPQNVLARLGLSVERMQSQGMLADVILLESDYYLTREEVDLILRIEHGKISTKEGPFYHFFVDNKSPDSRLLLLKYENGYFFIPEDLVPAMGEDL